MITAMGNLRQEAKVSYCVSYGGGLVESGYVVQCEQCSPCSCDCMLSNRESLHALTS